MKVGSIGPTMGMSTLDNGYLMLNNVRIPRGNMLMRNNKVGVSFLIVHDLFVSHSEKLIKTKSEIAVIFIS